MERDTLVAHGGSGMLRDRLCLQSDKYETYVCTRCGFLAEPARPKDVELPGMQVRANEPFCRNCNSTKSVKKRAMTYAFKLLIQELMSMNIGVRLDPQSGNPSGETGDWVTTTNEVVQTEKEKEENEFILDEEGEVVENLDEDELPPEDEWPEQEDEDEFSEEYQKEEE